MGLGGRGFGRDGPRNLVHALHRHAGISSADSAGLRRSDYAAVDFARHSFRGLGAGAGSRWQSVGIPADNGCHPARRRHRSDALHWHGGDSDSTGHSLRPCDLCRVRGRCDRGGIRSARTRFLAFRRRVPLEEIRCGIGDGWRDMRNALHRHGRGRFCAGFDLHRRARRDSTRLACRNHRLQHSDRIARDRGNRFLRCQDVRSECAHGASTQVRQRGAVGAHASCRASGTRAA